MNRRGKTKPDFDYLDAAERELFPNLPYHFLTRDQREQAYAYAKQMILTETGRSIP